MINGRILAAIAAAAMLAPACSTSAPQDLPVVGDWELVSGNDGVEEIPMVPGWRITFNSDGEHFGGTAACNGYGGTIVSDGNTLSFEELAWTEMACRPDVMASEQAYLAVFQRVDSTSRDGDVMLLSGEDAELWFVAVEPVPTAELIGTIWELDGLVSGEAVSSVQGEDLALVFDQDGTFSAGTGCRTLTGTYIAVGDEIQTPDLSAEGECPVELSAQDSHVVTVFEGGFTTAIDGNRLTLTIAGDEGLVYRAA